MQYTYKSFKFKEDRILKWLDFSQKKKKRGLSYRVSHHL